MGPNEGFGDDLLDSQSLGRSAGGGQTGAELGRDRNEGSVRMGRLNGAYALYAGVFGHVDVDDHEIGRTSTLAACHAGVHAIACFGEPLSKQITRQVVFL